MRHQDLLWSWGTSARDPFDDEIVYVVGTDDHDIHLALSSDGSVAPMLQMWKRVCRLERPGRKWWYYTFIRTYDNYGTALKAITSHPDVVLGNPEKVSP